ncbi:unnamed protein product [Notodromas monacha]|uniref:Ribonuclease H n=1 Tax=Notodromas monacha TaxID=399045 RepID=A0A7R9BVR4_9CRUS|nr:unnamed protein product [Notodromas monacha]CAG0922674.1 unnamed protein product [Notodromas monacha]
MPYYAVSEGVRPGIYNAWGECEQQVSRFPGAHFRKFSTREEAEDYMSDPIEVPDRILRQARLARSFEFTDDDFAVCYTDGSCKRSKGNAAGVGVWFGPRHVANISEPIPPPSTNNKAELLAVLYAIHAANEAGLVRLEIRSDSWYVINSCSVWIKKWRRNNWQTSNYNGYSKDVENQDEIRAIDEALSLITVRFEKVEAHSGEEGNEAADELANDAADESWRMYGR